MEKLFIRIKDGQPFEHPIQEDNFVQVFPNVDLKFLPPEFAKVKLVEPPDAGWFNVLNEPTYVWDDGVVTQIWTMSPRPKEEMALIREERTRTVLMWSQDAKVWANEQKQQTTDADTVQAWDAYIAKLEAWTLVDPFEPNLPFSPRIGVNGKLLDVNASGSAPNVIG